MFLLSPLFIYSFLRGEVKGGNTLYTVCRIWAGLFFAFTGIRQLNIFEEDVDHAKEHIFVSNHISYLDIPMMMKATKSHHIRILGKVEMSNIPVFGLIYKRAVVLVDRENVEQRKKSIKHLIAFLKLHISVFICPEGTFNMTNCPLKSFYNGAFQIAIETQNPISPILFLDTYDRLNYHSIFSLNPGRCRAVFLAETSTKGLTLQDLPMLKEKVYRQMENSLIRYKASWIKSPDC